MLRAFQIFISLLTRQLLRVHSSTGENINFHAISGCVFRASCLFAVFMEPSPWLRNVHDQPEDPEIQRIGATIMTGRKARFIACLLCTVSLNRRIRAVEGLRFRRPRPLIYSSSFESYGLSLDERCRLLNRLERETSFEDLVNARATGPPLFHRDISIIHDCPRSDGGEELRHTRRR